MITICTTNYTVTEMQMLKTVLEQAIANLHAKCGGFPCPYCHDRLLCSDLTSSHAYLERKLKEKAEAVENFVETVENKKVTK